MNEYELKKQYIRDKTNLSSLEKELSPFNKDEKRSKYMKEK